jgi:uncharacterized membrane protein
LNYFQRYKNLKKEQTMSEVEDYKNQMVAMAEDMFLMEYSMESVRRSVYSSLSKYELKPVEMEQVVLDAFTNVSNGKKTKLNVFTGKYVQPR